MIGQRKKGRFRLDIRKKSFTIGKGSESLAKVAQRGSRCPIPGDIQGQDEWHSGQPDIAVGVPVHCRGVGLDDL